MLEYLVRESTIEKPPLLIMLHGYGSNEQDLFSFATELPKELLIVSAKAPLTLGIGSYAWYSINFDGNNGKFSDLDEARKSIQQIENFIDTIIEKYKVNTKKVFLLGFSQGSILSYAVALKNPTKVQHVVALSGYINRELIPKEMKKEAYKKLDFFISHGTLDQVLPIDWSRSSLPILENLDIKFEYKEYPVGHGVNPQNFSDFNNWIINRI